MHDDDSRTPPSPPSPTAQTRQAPSSLSFFSSSSSCRSASFTALDAAVLGEEAAPPCIHSATSNSCDEDVSAVTSRPSRVLGMPTRQPCPHPLHGTDEQQQQQQQQQDDVQRRNLCTVTRHGRVRPMPKALSSTALGAPASGPATVFISTPFAATPPSTNAPAPTQSRSSQTNLHSRPSDTCSPDNDLNSSHSNKGVSQPPRQSATVFTATMGYSTSSHSYSINSNQSTVSLKAVGMCQASTDILSNTTTTVTTATTTTITTVAAHTVPSPATATVAWMAGHASALCAGPTSPYRLSWRSDTAEGGSGRGRGQFEVQRQLSSAASCSPCGGGGGRSPAGLPLSFDSSSHAEGKGETHQPLLSSTTDAVPRYPSFRRRYAEADGMSLQCRVQQDLVRIALNTHDSNEAPGSGSAVNVGEAEGSVTAAAREASSATDSARSHQPVAPDQAAEATARAGDQNNDATWRRTSSTSSSSSDEALPGNANDTVATSEFVLVRSMAECGFSWRSVGTRATSSLSSPPQPPGAGKGMEGGAPTVQGRPRTTDPYCVGNPAIVERRASRGGRGLGTSLATPDWVTTAPLASWAASKAEHAEGERRSTCVPPRVAPPPQPITTAVADAAVASSSAVEGPMTSSMDSAEGVSGTRREGSPGVAVPPRTAAERRAYERLERGVCGWPRPDWHPTQRLRSPLALPRRRRALPAETCDAEEQELYEGALLAAATAMASEQFSKP